MSWLEESKEYTSRIYEKYEKLEEKRAPELEVLLQDRFLLRSYLAHLLGQKSQLSKDLSSDMINWYRQRQVNFGTVIINGHQDLNVFGTYFKKLGELNSPNRFGSSVSRNLHDSEQVYCVIENRRPYTPNTRDFEILYIGHSKNTISRIEDSFHKNRPHEVVKQQTYQNVLNKQSVNPNIPSPILEVYVTTLSSGLARDIEGDLIRKCKENQNKIPQITNTFLNKNLRN